MQVEEESKSKIEDDTKRPMTRHYDEDMGV